MSFIVEVWFGTDKQQSYYGTIADNRADAIYKVMEYLQADEAPGASICDVARVECNETIYVE